MGNAEFDICFSYITIIFKIISNCFQHFGLLCLNCYRLSYKMSPSLSIRVILRFYVDSYYYDVMILPNLKLKFGLCRLCYFHLYLIIYFLRYKITFYSLLSNFTLNLFMLKITNYSLFVILFFHAKHYTLFPYFSVIYAVKFFFDAGVAILFYVHDPNAIPLFYQLDFKTTK